MHRNSLFDLDQTLLDFQASEYIALRIVLMKNGLSFTDEIYQAFKEFNKSLWLELEKGPLQERNFSLNDLSISLGSAREIHQDLIH